MKYVCLVYVGPSPFDTMSQAELEELDEQSVANDEELARRGHLIAAQALEPPATATTVRVRNGRLSTTDGPFAETAEHLGGFVFLEARDLNEAIRLAAGMPIARYASIEVRPATNLVERVRERAAIRAAGGAER